MLEILKILIIYLESHLNFLDKNWFSPFFSNCSTIFNNMLFFSILLTVPRRCLFCGSFLLFMFLVCQVFLSVHCSLVVTCWEMAVLLALLYVMFYYVLSRSHVVSCVRCGAWLYWYLIIAFILTFNRSEPKRKTYSNSIPCQLFCFLNYLIQNLSV